MRTKLITALRLTANAIENGTFNYDWRQTESCNCGALACTVMGISRAEMRDMIADMKVFSQAAEWKKIVPNFCPITGIPTHGVLRALTEIGLTPAEIMELECLSNKEVQARMRNRYKSTRKTVGALWWKKEKLVKGWHEYPEAAADYMRTWAEMIQETERDDSASQSAQGSEVHARQGEVGTLRK